MKFRVGIFQIVLKGENKSFLKTSTDLERAFGSDIFQLNAGLHSNACLQNDWNRLGPDAFECKVFDELKVDDTASPTEINCELEALLEMHLEEMRKSGQAMY